MNCSGYVDVVYTVRTRNHSIRLYQQALYYRSFIKTGKQQILSGMLS